MKTVKIYSFGEWVRYRRKMMGLTQVFLAHQVGCATITIRKIESDERRPSRTMAKRLAECLAIPESESENFILGGLGEVSLYAVSISSEMVRKESGQKDLFESNKQVDQISAKISEPANNLPPQSTPFIGREADLSELDTLIRNPDIRLVTIIGPGGIGKTRLALAFGEQIVQGARSNFSFEYLQTSSFRDGVFFVDLTPISEVKQLVLAVAGALNILLQGGAEPENTPMNQLLSYLGDKQIFLILDNFEQILAGAQFVSDLLEAGPNVHVLVTSRERLQLKKEQLYPIPALDFREWDSPDEAAEFTAVKIFLQAARRIRPGFELTSTDMPHLTRICHLVGGMPLALELAAGWIELLPLSEIAAEIKRSLDFLSTELQDVPNRHRSIRAVLDATWDRMTKTERALIQKLSAFRRGFSRQAAAHVMAEHDEPNMYFHLLGRLVNKSVLIANPDQDRYQIHELLRQYAHEQLKLTGGYVAVRTAHSIYFTDFVNQREADLKGKKVKVAMDEIESDFANIRAAWEWALSQEDQMAIDRMLNGLCLFCSMQGRHLDGIDLLQKAEKYIPINANPIKNKVWRRTVMARIFLDHDVWFGDFNEKLEITERILEEAKQDDNCEELAFVFLNLGWLQWDLNLDVSLKYLDSSLALYRQSSDLYFETHVLLIISSLHLSLGALDKRVSNIEKVLELARKTGNHLLIAYALYEIGFNAEISGLYAEAERNYQEAHMNFVALNDKHWGSENTARLGWLALLKGDIENATVLIEQGVIQAKKYNLALPMQKAQGMLAMLLILDGKYALAVERCKELAQFVSYWAFGGLIGLAYASCGLEDYAAARKYLHKAIEVSVSMRALSWQTQCLPAVAILATVDGNKERATEVLSLAFHHPASATGWLEIFPLVTRLQIGLQRDLPPHIFKYVWERGQKLDLEETITLI